MRFSQFSYFSANSCSIVVCIGMLSRIIRANLVSMTRCMTRYIVCYGISWDCTIYYFGSNMRNKYSGLFLLKKSSQNNKHVQNLIDWNCSIFRPWILQENIAPFCPRNGTLWFGSVLLAHFMHGCKRKKGKKRRTIQDNARDNDVHTDTIPSNETTNCICQLCVWYASVISCYYFSQITKYRY